MAVDKTEVSPRVRPVQGDWHDVVDLEVVRSEGHVADAAAALLCQ